jgi:hypothetical protein
LIFGLLPVAVAVGNQVCRVPQAVVVAVAKF